MIKKTELAWAKNWYKQYPNGEHFTFKDLGVYVQGKFSEPHTLGFGVYSLETEKRVATIYGATTKEDLLKLLEENRAV